MMMSDRPLMNSNAMSPTTDVDFAFAPMQQSYQLGFDAGMSLPPSVVERPLFQQHHNLVYDTNNFDFAAGFPFQQDSSVLPPPTSLPLPPPPPPCMGMALPSSLLMPPLVTLPGVPTTAEMYPFGSGSLMTTFLKREDGGPVVGSDGERIGLNLGRRTYFSPADVLAVDRLLRTRSRLGGGGSGGLGMAGVLGLGLGAAHHHQPPRCQAEGCKADLSAAKHYHRRHKVCEHHAKAAAVATTGGKQQRFCQQCSRFHVLAEFDGTKRSCRKRLTEHNRRRRKPASAQSTESSPPVKKAGTPASITTSYNSDHKSASTAAAKSAAISPNGSGGVNCLDTENGHGQASSGAAPTALSLAALPLPAEKDGGLDTMLMQQVRGRGGDDDDEQRFMTSLMLQAQQHHSGNSSSGRHGGGGGNILSCSSVSVHHQQNGGGCNGFFEVDFI